MLLDRGETEIDHFCRGSSPNRSEAVGAIRGQVEAIARRCGFSESVVQDMGIAVSEAATNAIVQGQVEVDAEQVVRVALAGGETCVVVADQGRGMLPRHDSPGLGLGLPIISMLAQRIEVISPGDDGQTEVHTCTSAAAHRPRERLTPISLPAEPRAAARAAASRRPLDRDAQARCMRADGPRAGWCSRAGGSRSRRP